MINRNSIECITLYYLFFITLGGKIFQPYIINIVSKDIIHYNNKFTNIKLTTYINI